MMMTMMMVFLVLIPGSSDTSTQPRKKIRSFSSISHEYTDACGFRSSEPFEESSEAALQFLTSLKECRNFLNNETKSIENDIVRWTRIHHEWSVIETERTLNASTSLSESQTEKNMWIKRLNNTLNGQLSATYYTSQLIIIFLFSLFLAFMISKYLGSEISRRAIFSWASKTLSPHGGRRSRKQILTELPKLFRGTWHHDCDESLQSLLKLVRMVY